MEKRNHHIATLVALIDSRMTRLYDRLHPGDGESFGLKPDFSGTLTVYDDGDLDKGLVTSLHNIPKWRRIWRKPIKVPELQPGFADRYGEALRKIEVELDRNYVPDGFNGNAFEHAKARETALRISVSMDLIDGTSPVDAFVRDFDQWVARERKK